MSIFCPHIKLTKKIIKFVTPFKSSEELLRGGGIPIDLLDKAAFGFTEKSVKTLMPEQLKIRWIDDFENVKFEISEQGLSDKEWAQYIDLSEPIDVEYWKDEKEGFYEGFYVADGHHRYYAAKILGKPLNVNLEIKVNPITKMAPELGYDDFHKCIFKQVNLVKKENEVSSTFLRQMARNATNKLAQDFLIGWANRGANNVTTLSNKELFILKGIRRDGKVPTLKKINELKIRKFIRGVLSESFGENHVDEDIELKDISDDFDEDSNEGYWDRVKIIAKNKSGEQVGYAILDMYMDPYVDQSVMDDDDAGRYSDEEIEQHFPDDYAAKLEHLEVLPIFREKGYGNELMDAVVKYVKERNYKTLYLIASPIGFNPKISLDDLSKFYEKYGLKVVKDFDNARDMVAQLRESFVRNTVKSTLKESLLFEITIKDAWEKFYSDVNKFPAIKGDEILFNKLNDICPKKGENFSKGYFTWLYNLLKNNRLKEEDFYKAKEYLRIFDKFINKIPKENRDINKFKNLSDLYNVVKEFEGGEDTIATSKTAEIKSIKENEVEKVFDNGTWLILIPKTERAACLVGKNTQWCTSADKSYNQFDFYNNQGPLYVIINKEENTKYQLHFESLQLVDEKDRDMSPSYFFEHIVEDTDVLDFLKTKYENFWEFILENEEDRVAENGYYGNLFNTALNMEVDKDVLEQTLGRLRRGESYEANYLGFIYEKNPSNINLSNIKNFFENGNEKLEYDDIDRVIKHLMSIGFDATESDIINRFIIIREDLDEHNIELDLTYNIDKGRKLKVNRVNFDNPNGDYNITIYYENGDNDNGDVNLETILNLIHQGQLFEGV